MSSKKTTLKNTEGVIATIKMIVSSECDISVLELEGGGEWKRRRGRKSAYDARAIAMNLCRIYTEATLEKVGESFGDRGHATVHYAQKKVADLHECKNWAFCRLYDRCKKLVHDYLLEPEYYI